MRSTWPPRLRWRAPPRRRRARPRPPRGVAGSRRATRRRPAHRRGSARATPGPRRPREPARTRAGARAWGSCPSAPRDLRRAPARRGAVQRGQARGRDGPPRRGRRRRPTRTRASRRFRRRHRASTTPDHASARGSSPAGPAHRRRLRALPQARDQDRAARTPPTGRPSRRASAPDRPGRETRGRTAGRRPPARPPRDPPSRPPPRATRARDPIRPTRRLHRERPRGRAAPGMSGAPARHNRAPPLRDPWRDRASARRAPQSTRRSGDHPALERGAPPPSAPVRSLGCGSTTRPPRPGRPPALRAGRAPRRAARRAPRGRTSAPLRRERVAPGTRSAPCHRPRQSRVSRPRGRMNQRRRPLCRDVARGARRRPEDIAGLDVAVKDAALVQFLERTPERVGQHRAESLTPILSRAVQRGRPRVCSARHHRRPFNPFGDEKALTRVEQRRAPPAAHPRKQRRLAREQRSRLGRRSGCLDRAKHARVDVPRAPNVGRGASPNRPVSGEGLPRAPTSPRQLVCHCWIGHETLVSKGCSSSSVNSYGTTDIVAHPRGRGCPRPDRVAPRDAIGARRGLRRAPPSRKIHGSTRWPRSQ